MKSALLIFFSFSAKAGERVICLIQDLAWIRQCPDAFEATCLPTNNLAKELIFYLPVHQNSKGAKHFVTALIEALGSQLRGQKIFTTHLPSKVRDPRILEALRIMEVRLGDIPLNEVALQSGLSVRSLNRLFLLEVGIGPKDFLVLRKIDRAKVLLRETRMTVTDISLEVGYNSLSSFIETFKRLEGKMPSDCRNG